LAKATISPEAELAYSGNSSDAMEKVIEKLPAIAIPNRNIRIFLNTKSCIKRIPMSRKRVL
jgi:hypothetical protein